MATPPSTANIGLHQMPTDPPLSLHSPILLRSLDKNTTNFHKTNKLASGHICRNTENFQLSMSIFLKETSFKAPSFCKSHLTF